MKEGEREGRDGRRRKVGQKEEGGREGGKGRRRRRRRMEEGMEGGREGRGGREKEQPGNPYNKESNEEELAPADS